MEVSGPVEWMNMFGNVLEEAIDGLSSESVGFKVDVVETDEAINITGDLPGVDKEDLSIEVKHGKLKIVAERKPSVSGSICHVRERHHGKKFTRTIYLPPGIINFGDRADNITARLDKGVLFVTILKEKPNQPASVKIEVQ